MRKYLLLFLSILVLVLVGCTAGPNTAACIPAVDGSVAGFWLGLWHGLIAAITFVASLFYDGVSVYEIHNNGGWYDFGFLLGAGVLIGGGVKLL